MNQLVQMSFKNRIHLLYLFLSFWVIFSGCSTQSSKNKSKLFKIYGEAQGTTYTIQVFDSNLKFTKQEIDSLLFAFDLELSTYQSSSVISYFNAIEFRDTLLKIDSRLVTMLELSDSVYRLSDGLFDPSIKPLISLWGFDSKLNRVPNQGQIDSVLRFVNFSRGTHYDLTYVFDSTLKLMKYNPDFQLDFNAIAQGFAVDEVMKFIKSRGHINVYIELGGEIALSGRKLNSEEWKIGVERPIENNSTSDKVVHKVFSITDKCIATSGDYRKYFEVNGKKYAHTINPKTGYQNQNSLLSATVFSETCALSDAFATVFMLLGLEGTKDFIEQHPELGLDVFLIYDFENTYQTYFTEGLKSSMN